MATKETQLALLRKQAETLLNRINELEAQPEDTFKDGDVLRLYKKYGNSPKEYTFVVLKIGSNWYSSGSGATSQTWDELVEYFGVEAILNAQRVGSWKKAY